MRRHGQVAAHAAAFPARTLQPAAAKLLPQRAKAAQAAAPENQTLAKTAKAAPAVHAMVAGPAYEDTGSAAPPGLRTCF
jgi:hypothetical protein